MRSLTILVALALISVHFVAARVPNPEDRRGKRDASPNPKHGILNFIRDVFGLQARQEEQVCVEDDIYQALESDSLAPTFCSQWLSLPPATVVSEYTPAV